MIDCCQKIPQSGRDDRGSAAEPGDATDVPGDATDVSGDATDEPGDATDAGGPVAPDSGLEAPGSYQNPICYQLISSQPGMCASWRVPAVH